MEFEWATKEWIIIDEEKWSKKFKEIVKEKGENFNFAKIGMT